MVLLAAFLTTRDRQHKISALTTATVLMKIGRAEQLEISLDFSVTVFYLYFIEN